MAVLNQNRVTMLDMVKRRDPNGAPAKIVEVLDKQTCILQDAQFKSGNLDNGHVFTSRTGLPSVGWTQFNKGIPRSKSKTDQITEACGTLAGKSEVDKRLADLYGEPAAFRASEDVAWLESFSQKFEESFFYSSSKTDPAAVMGVSPRLDSLSGPYARQVINADVSASGNDQASIWGVVWGDTSVYGITPKNSPSGLQHTDMGVVDLEDENGETFPGYRTYWHWNFGWCVQDYRKIVRIANLDTGNLSMTADTLFPLFTKAYYRLHKPEMGRLVWYCNRTVAEFIEHQARSAVKGGAGLTWEDVDGRPVMKIKGAQVHVTEGLLSSESVVV